MPTYQYLCKNCGHQFDELQSITEPPLTTCPQCAKETLARVVGSGSGVIFKGSGFYKTDYAKAEAKTSKAAAKSGEKKEGGDSAASPADSKPSPPASTESKKE